MSDKSNTKLTKYSLPMQLALAIFCITGLVSTIYILIKEKSYNPLDQVFDLVIYVATLFYFTKGYKKPHSNILKYIFILFVITSTYHGLSYHDLSKAYSYSLITTSVLLAFISGRLNKFKQNRWILVLGFVLLLTSSIYVLINFPTELSISLTYFDLTIYKWSHFNSLLQYLTITLAYLSRCYTHLKAGELVDEEEEI